MCTLCDSTNINTIIEFVPKLFVACQRWWLQWRFAAILVNCAPSGEMRNYCTPHNIKENFGNFLIHRCNYILLSQVYCVWQVVKTPTIIFNNLVFSCYCLTGALYVHPLWFYKHQHDNRVRSKLCSISAVMVSMAIRRHLSKLRSKRRNA